ncbi:hypothetical protein P3T23_007769 [Paraburkholderia sp. GAS448]|uniref:hypothetical protein n=1 Tax=Paraburkholderia sp. GAS448 TaxID=3035136 RepID=UPI003D242961
MDAPDTPLRGQNTTAAGRLYMAFELGEKNWKLSLSDGQRAPSRCTVAAGDTTAVLTAIANARARCHLSADAPRKSPQRRENDAASILSGKVLTDLCDSEKNSN